MEQRYSREVMERAIERADQALALAQGQSKARGHEVETHSRELPGAGRSYGYDGPEDVRRPQEIGPPAGSREAVAIELRALAHQEREEHGHER